MGAVPAKLWETLQHSPALQEELTRQLLDEFWPPTLHNAIRQAIGLPNADTQIVGIRQRIIRSPRFREEVLRAYERRCAICGYDGRLADTLLGLEAAHIKWHAYLGPDQVDNGVTLCSFHHVALDAGALGFSNDLRILVSCDVKGDSYSFHSPAIRRRRKAILPGTVMRYFTPPRGQNGLRISW